MSKSSILLRVAGKTITLSSGFEPSSNTSRKHGVRLTIDTQQPRLSITAEGVEVERIPNHAESLSNSNKEKIRDMLSALVDLPVMRALVSVHHAIKQLLSAYPYLAGKHQKDSGTILSSLLEAFKVLLIAHRKHNLLNNVPNTY